jgi:hypothetical protein
MPRRTSAVLVLPLLILTTFAPVPQIPVVGAELTPADYSVEVDGLADWSTSRPYIDAAMLFRRWGMPNAGWQENPGLQLAPDNYPLGDTDAVSHLRAYPDGVYKLRYEGSAIVTFVGIGEVVTGSTRRANNVTTADVQVTHRGPDDLISIQIRNVNPKNPLRNLQLLAPGYTFDDAKKQVFTSEFLRRVRPFGTIRFMGWMQANGTPVKEWADRPTPAIFGRTGPKGVPIEEIEALANGTGRSVWVNVPQAASDDFVRQFAAHLRDHLHKDAIVHVEYANELWNFGFTQAHDNLRAARANKALTKPEDFGKCAQQAAERLGQIARIFKSTFGDEQFEKRIRPVVGGFIANEYWAGTQLAWIKEHHPKLIRELAIAPYFGLEDNIKAADVPGATADQLFDAADAWIIEKVAPWVQNHARLARDNGLTLVAYEGGNHFTFTNNANGPLKLQMQHLPRMARSYQLLLDTWGENGGTLFNQFGHISPYSKFGSWGLLESMNDPGSVKWDFFMSKVLPKGDANLDGRVTFADFEILKANFGQSGKWWEQGDFNADNKVDVEDLKLMKENLRDISAAEAAQVERLLK